MAFLKQLLVQSQEELVALLLAALWVMLRVAKVVVKNAEEGKPLSVLIGKHVISLTKVEKHRTQQAKGKTGATGG